MSVMRQVLCGMAATTLFLSGCGPSAIEVENQELKAKVEQLSSQMAQQSTAVREKELEVQTAKLEWEKEKLELTAQVQQLQQQVTSSTGMGYGSAAVGVARLQEVYMEDLLPSFAAEVPSDLSLVDALNKSPFLKDQKWDAANERQLIFTANVDRGQMAGREALKGILLAVTEEYSASGASLMEGVPGGSLIGSFVKKAAGYSMEGIADNISDSYLQQLQEIINNNVPAFGIQLDFTVPQNGSPRVRSQQFSIKNQDGSIRRIPIPEPSHELVLMDIATNPNPIAMSALMLHEFALNQVKDLVVGLVTGKEEPATTAAAVK